MNNAGLITMCSFISPYRSERQMVRSKAGDEVFIEVFVDTPLSVAEERDVKGLYKRARAGEIKNFTGIDSEYQPPENPEIHINTVETPKMQRPKSLTILKFLIDQHLNGAASAWAVCGAYGDNFQALAARIAADRNLNAPLGQLRELGELVNLFANALVDEEPDMAFAVLTHLGPDAAGYRVSVRAPMSRPTKHASAFAAEFGGGGRAEAAGIDLLTDADMNRFVRIGLAHGGVRGFGSEGQTGREIIPPDRAQSARLDYLALGDWHARAKISPRCFYPGTPEPDRHKSGARGQVLAVTLEAGQSPKVTDIATANFDWPLCSLRLEAENTSEQLFESFADEMRGADRQIASDALRLLFRYAGESA